ncbi:MAG: DUF3556 domain-containing protein [Nannocystales bacterium]
MGLLSPTPTPYDPLEWEGLPLPEKLKWVCRAWVVQGYGTPLAIYGAYGLKVAAYIGGWVFFCSLSPSLGSWTELGQWWSHPVAFEKAILWSLLFEVMGFGCGSGPLTGRYLPPVGGLLYWLRPGTTKLPPWPQLPGAGGHQRTWLDVLAYAGLLGLTVRALLLPQAAMLDWVAVLVALLVLGLRDRTIVLAARVEHYGVTAVCFAFSPNPLAGAMAVQLALWFFAGVSKLNHHFPTVVSVMTSNSPSTPLLWLRKRMVRGYPDDLRPSALAAVAGHFGTALELGVPLVLLAGEGGTVTLVGLVLMLVLHTFITSNVPMGVPLEWNVMVVYGGFVLFGAHNLHLADVGLPVGLFLVLTVVVVPLVGNVVPDRVSFLLSMRYYAGNWPCSVWLFRDEAWRKLERLTKSAPWVYDQLAVAYDRGTSVGLVGKVMAFRAMHLHGRALPTLVPRAIEGAGEFERFHWLDGELVAGLALGWNFGDGHLHHEQLVDALQAQCGFERGELRIVCIESQPLHRQTLDYRLLDAASGELDRGRIPVATLRGLQPWESMEPPPHG